jgi:hypothetical protein
LAVWRGPRRVAAGWLVASDAPVTDRLDGWEVENVTVRRGKMLADSQVVRVFKEALARVAFPQARNVRPTR